jgi:crotonobetaine/carnitine-CoA ligase
MGYPVWTADIQGTVTAVLVRAAEQFPQRTFLDFQGEKHTYGEMDEQSTRLAHGLLARGVVRGDQMAMA